jgi:hypothetical protein
MQSLSESASRTRPVFLYAGVPLIVTGLLWWASPFEVSFLQLCAAFVLGWIPWSSYQQWKRGDKHEIPLFTLVSGMFWLSYAVPLFLTAHSVGLVTGKHSLSEDSITKSLYLATFGVAVLFSGMRLAERWRWLPRTTVDVPIEPSRWNYLRVLLVSGILLRILVPIDALGGEGRQVIVNLETILPAVTFAIIFRRFLRGDSRPWDRSLILGYVAVGLMTGIASGWLGSFVGLGLMCAAIYVYERRKVPMAAVLIVLPVILFFQPGKNAFRIKFWRSGEASATQSEKISFWIATSWRLWSDAVTDSNGDVARDLAQNTLMRFSLLQQTANVVELTPTVVPYQRGRLYSYLLVTMIPRFAWPNKPSVNDANHWYQVSYRLTAHEDLRHVNIAVGTLAESYINFGWLGPIIIVFPLGIFLGSFQRIFLRADSGLFLSSLGAVMLPQLIAIESQMAEYVAGLLQQILIVLVVLIPILRRSRMPRSAQRLVSRHSGRVATIDSVILPQNRMRPFIRSR